MRLAGLLHVTECNRERFSKLRQRGQLPFRVAGEYADQAKRPNFTLEHAFEIRLFLDLCDAGGVGIESALGIIGNGLRIWRWHENGWHPLDAAPELPAVHLWGATFGPHAGLDFAPKAWGGSTLATLSDALARVAAEREECADVARLVTVNATRAARFVRLRALESGIPEGDGLTPLWPRLSSPDDKSETTE